MSTLRVLSALSLLLAVVVGAPQHLTEQDAPQDTGKHFLTVSPDHGGGGGGSGPGSVHLAPFPSPSRGGSRPLFPVNGPAGSPGAAVGLAGSAAHNQLGLSGGLKGVGVRVFQSDSGDFSLGAGFSSNLKGANAGGLHAVFKL